MKTAISLPDQLFHEIDSRAKALKLTRSALIARAAREFLQNHGPAKNPTDAWNQVVKTAGQPGDAPAAVAARKRTKTIIRRSQAWDR